MRIYRLQSDFKKLKKLTSSKSFLNISWEGELPERYVITYKCKGLVLEKNYSTPQIKNQHQLKIYLHKDYPRRPPKLKFLTDIFHPNMLPSYKNGGVCIGAWTPAESLSQLCIRIGKMIEYQIYNLNDELNKEAVSWVKKNTDKLPVDTKF